MARSDFPSEEAFQRNIARVVVPRDRIARRVGELAGQITHCYNGREVTVLAVLTGALVFLSDLVRDMPVQMRLDLITVSSYPGPVTRSQGPKLRIPASMNLKGRDVLIVDDILDSGQTLEFLRETVRKMSPASLRTCVLLQKIRPDLPDRMKADFVGFDVQDEFVVGYGLDYNHLYRNLPDICVLTEAAMKEASR